MLIIRNGVLAAVWCNNNSNDNYCCYGHIVNNLMKITLIAMIIRITLKVIIIITITAKTEARINMIRLALSLLLQEIIFMAEIMMIIVMIMMQ